VARPHAGGVDASAAVSATARTAAGTAARAQEGHATRGARSPHPLLLKRAPPGRSGAVKASAWRFAPDRPDHLRAPLFEPAQRRFDAPGEIGRAVTATDALVGRSIHLCNVVPPRGSPPAEAWGRKGVAP
jgi:hypothetical protein